jgi:hypothetical protein
MSKLPIGGASAEATQPPVFFEQAVDHPGHSNTLFDQKIRTPTSVKLVGRHAALAHELCRMIADKELRRHWFERDLLSQYFTTGCNPGQRASERARRPVSPKHLYDEEI